MSRSKSRAAARIAAVQALYQHDMEGTHLAGLLDEFHRHRLGGEIDDEVDDTQYAEAEVAFFDDLVKGSIARREEIDELIARADVSTGTAISEYVDVAHAFFDARESKFVNGVLDSVAKAVR